MKCKKLLSCILLALCFLLYQGQQNKSFAYISVDSGDMAQAIVDAITDNASIFQQNNQTNASNSISYYEQAIENIDKVELATAINKFLDKIQTASGDISFNDISMYVYIQNSSYTIYPLQLRIIYSSFNSDSDVSRYTIYANNDGTGFEIAPYDTNKGFLYQDIQITPQGKVYGLSWSSFTPLIRKTSIYQYRFPAINNVNIEERTGGLFYKPLISFGTSQFITLNNGGDIYGLNLNRLNFSDSGGITTTPSGDTPSGDTPGGDTSGDTPGGDTNGDTTDGNNSGDQSYAGLINAINNQNTDYWGTSGEMTIDTQSGEINQALNETLDNLSGELADNEIISTLKTAEKGILDIFEYGKDNPLGLDFIVSWETVTYNGNILIPSGEINFSKNVREIPILSTVMAYVRTILSFWCAWALIVQIYNLLLSTLGIDNPYLYENVRETDIVNAYTGEANTVYTKTKRLYRWWK